MVGAAGSKAVIVPSTDVEIKLADSVRSNPLAACHDVGMLNYAYSKQADIY
ncbi:hypothetical protein [Jeongeupia naejangsanensis]|uniref:Uncharacterized protein n=1 Tax=Jeongeupia naejangsanensis TaxID=613195 RepID=A0ABS2BPE4_9NEIS|nr:hypothetical protein [Jeongeupia naejangsanensis]MBM3117502.1 hypothetical protein [Jeongeupia naejangsanensis]